MAICLELWNWNWFLIRLLPLAPNWRTSIFKMRLHETERSLNVLNSGTKVGLRFFIINIINLSWNICRITRTPTTEKISFMNFKNFTIMRLEERINQDWAVIERSINDRKLKTQRFYTILLILWPLRHWFSWKWFFELCVYVWFDRLYSFN